MDKKYFVRKVDEAESENVIKHALDLGYNFFDTANGYSAGTSEEWSYDKI